MKSRGFTVVEILVSLSVMTLLTGVLILYGRTGESQIVLFKDQAKIINTIFKTKSLALSTYAKSGAPCAYGVHFEKNPATDEWEFRIFMDLDKNGVSKDCLTPGSEADSKYTPSALSPNPEDLSPPIVEKLDKTKGVGFKEPLAVTDVVFIPPDPMVIITPPPAGNEATIEIQFQESVSKKIKINKFGQITAE